MARCGLSTQLVYLSLWCFGCWTPCAVGALMLDTSQSSWPAFTHTAADFPVNTSLRQSVLAQTLPSASASTATKSTAVNPLALSRTEPAAPTQHPILHWLDQFKQTSTFDPNSAGAGGQGSILSGWAVSLGNNTTVSAPSLSGLAVGGGQVSYRAVPVVQPSSSDGEGEGTDPDNNVPEPSTALLLSLSAGMLWHRFRKRHMQ
ncbi:PEP-CTERM sorting domain-containing protein [Planctomycetota bacterium]